jgi:hypothetical protein
MKGQNNFFGFKSFILAALMLFGSVAAFANNSDISKQAISSIAGNLSQKLRTDLADNSATVKINNIEKQQLSKNLVDLKGSAYCVLKNENNQLPIQFEAKINPQTQAVSDINYTFVEEESAEYAPTTTEEVLMKEIMKKISADYKTDSIVMSIDGFEIVQSGDAKEYEGVGEIKVGEVEWSKINFKVALDSGNKASKIIYDIK